MSHYLIYSGRGINGWGGPPPSAVDGWGGIGISSVSFDSVTPRRSIRVPHCRSMVAHRCWDGRGGIGNQHNVENIYAPSPCRHNKETFSKIPKVFAVPSVTPSSPYGGTHGFQRGDSHTHFSFFLGKMMCHPTFQGDLTSILFTNLYK